jgi:hypothetical protein
MSRPKIDHGPCGVEGCSAPFYAKGKCWLHWLADWRKNRKTLPCSFPGCDKPSVARGLCHTHYKRVQIHGDVNYTETIIKKLSWSRPDEIKTWLLAHREIDANGCWLWTRSREGGGYGNQVIEKRLYKVSRVSASLWLGFDITSPLQILHSCDNPPCFNPSHLFPGTQKDNMKDMCRKNRKVVAQGERSGGAKLTDSQVREIRKLRGEGNRTKDLADQFRVYQTAIDNIYARRTWKNLTV